MLAGYQVTAGGANSVSMQQSNGQSYWTNMNVSGSSIGTMGGYIDAMHAGAEQNLAALSTTGYVDQVLYYYGSNPDSGNPGTAVGYLRTYADGHTVLNPANAPTTPIPAAAYLFGSGLLGLIGLRRKMAA